LYLNQRFNWLVTKNLTISEKFKYRSYTGESSYTLNAIIDLDFAITQNLSLNASYEIERDTTESENNIGIEDEDVDISLGIMINF
jgi:putative salt-induced outer membrane protein YdiY